MAILEEFYREFETLPESMQADVMQYVNFLQYQLKNEQKNDSLIEQPTQSYTEKQQRLFELMTQTAKRGTAFSGIDVLDWQSQQRQDKPLALRDE